MRLRLSSIKYRKQLCVSRLIRRRRDQGFKIYKLKGNLSWLRVLQTVCNLYIFFIIRDEFEFNDLEYCVLISISNLNMFIQTHTHKPSGAYNEKSVTMEVTFSPTWNSLKLLLQKGEKKVPTLQDRRKALNHVKCPNK